MLSIVKLDLRITGANTAFDSEILGLIRAAIADLEMIGIRIYYAEGSDGDVLISDPLIQRAIITFCRCNFGEPDNYAQLKAAYDEQKAQFRCNPLYIVR